MNDKPTIKCGIEIHQQLSGKKLFCSCPTLLRDDAPDFTIRRKIRAVAGEGGKIDVAAAQEQQRDITFIYQGYKDTTCLVEADCEPPHELNKDALYTVLQFCKLVQAQVYPIVQVMRKTVVDGSNTSGFQRTALIAKGGIIKTEQGEVRIDNISLEEDACKNVDEKDKEKDNKKEGDNQKERDNEKIYRLDRLGIPLIEIGTAPDITSPEQCLETAKKIGNLLRSLPGVKRGLGTIRQDVNVSIEGGSRVEIKGAQELKMLPVWVEMEAKRQQELLKIKEELNVKKIKLNEFKIYDLTEKLSKSTSKIISKTIQSKGKILGIKLNGFSGYTDRELQPNYRLGTEFSGRAKIKAGVGGIFHSNELPNYGITAEEVELIKKELSCRKEDAFILVADKEEKSMRALEAVYERAQEVFTGVPKEVRKANADGTTAYMRPMPGAARMYPETDVPLVKPDTRKIEVPETLEEKFVRYQKELGLGKDLAEFIAKSEYMTLFEEIINKYKSIKPAFVAETISAGPSEMKKKHNLDTEKITEEHFRELFKLMAEGKVQKAMIPDVLMELMNEKFDSKKYESISADELKKVVKEIVEKNKNAPFGALVGMCMKALGGKASGQEIAEELKGAVEKAPSFGKLKQVK